MTTDSLKTMVMGWGEGVAAVSLVRPQGVFLTKGKAERSRRSGGSWRGRRLARLRASTSRRKLWWSLNRTRRAPQKPPRLLEMITWKTKICLTRRMRHQEDNRVDSDISSAGLRTTTMTTRMRMLQQMSLG